MLRSKGEKAFGVFNLVLMTLMAIVFVFPVLFVIKTSLDLSPPSIDLSLLPRQWTLMFYRMIVNDSGIYRPLINSVFVTAVGTFGSMVLTCMGGYALSKRDLPGMTQLVYFLVVIPMFIGGGIVASFILFKSLNWLNTYTVLIVPGMFSAFNMIIVRNYFWSIPKSLIEAAKIDGAGEFTVFMKIMIPLSKPVIAATTLFTGVGYWNQYMSSILYITSQPQKMLFPVKIKSLLFDGLGPDKQNDFRNTLDAMGYQNIGMDSLNQDALAAAMTIISFTPILVAYPFLQKYFAAGMLKGSIKG